jgi:hypothetical protein
VALAPVLRPLARRARASVAATDARTPGGIPLNRQAETESGADAPAESEAVRRARETADVRRWDPPRGTRTVADARKALGPVARERFGAACERASVAYPPPRITLLAFKEERILEVWAANRTGAYRKIGEYPVLAASGGPGPKRREGDLQVPEGVYRLTTLNPNSRFHLSLRVDYPNATDLANRLGSDIPTGGDIYVHGSAVSIGCLALGDPAIEELFPLVALADPRERHILIAPHDLRTRPSPPAAEAWIGDVYRDLTARLGDFPPSRVARLHTETRTD